MTGQMTDDPCERCGDEEEATFACVIDDDGEEREMRLCDNCIEDLRDVVLTVEGRPLYDEPSSSSQEGGS
jgi:Protein of unknown function (DUF3716)